MMMASLSAISAAAGDEITDSFTLTIQEILIYELHFLDFFVIQLCH